MDSEKKIKLDDLPDEKSGSPQPTSIRQKKTDSSSIDPRIEKLKSLDHHSQVEQMTKSWHFDKQRRLWGWVVFVLGLIVLEKNGYYAAYTSEIDLLDAKSMNLGGALYQGILGGGEILIKHPIVFAFLTPFLFRFREPSDVYFDVTFDGILVPKKVNIAAKEILSRVLVRWGDIVDVQQVSGKNQRPVLVLISPNGPIGELIWDIDMELKKAVKLLMNGLIPNKHPLRIYLEKELK